MPIDGNHKLLQSLDIIVIPNSTMTKSFVLLCLAGLAGHNVHAFSADIPPPPPATPSSPMVKDAVDFYNSKFPPAERTGMSAITEDECAEAFNILAKLYGDENAMDMVKSSPICLAFNSENFEGSLNAFSNKFGLEETKEMIKRNPNLLAVRPELAAKSDDSTMMMSYVVGATRPIGAVLLGLLGVALLTPLFNGLTGMQIGQ